MKLFTRSYAFRMVAVIAAALLLSSAAFAVKPASSVEISILMGQARQDAVLADKDMTALESYSMAGVPWQVHFLRLQEIQVHVNDLMKDVNQLRAIESNGTPSQQDAINRLDSLVSSMAANVRVTIKYLNQNHSRVNMPPFNDQVHIDRLLINSIYNVTRAHAPKNNMYFADAPKK
ncbi:hypothetical protein P8935_14740 [Telmatobacter sp. DSM 110680]|uniref:Uncharacterized protein n=1 Tax=Telmatobacter sp. DSM 110680 TaxID=3036704 RepID=A0AAU7DER4_9BACT